MPRRIVAPGRSCLECRRRKIKCDRSFPCSYCVRSQIQCAYPPRRSERSIHHAHHSNDFDLPRRVERIESTLELLGKGSSQVRDSPRANLPSTFSQSTDQNDGREIADGPGDGRGSECQVGSYGLFIAVVDDSDASRILHDRMRSDTFLFAQDLRPKLRLSG